MIDLRKVALLGALLELPFTFVMPNTLFEAEWLSIPEEEKQALCAAGLEIRELPGESVTRAARHFNENRHLQLNDCFALALAEDIEDSILLTGDSALRRIAEESGLEVRGVLWVIDELEAKGVVPLRRLYEALETFRDDEFVFLPENEVLQRMRRLARLL